MSESEDPYEPPQIKTDELAESETSSKEMSFWLAVGLSVLVLMTMIGVQVVAVVPFFFARMAGRPPSDLARITREIETDGTVLAVATCLTTLVCTALVWLIVRLCGWNVREYVRLKWPAKASHIMTCFLLVIGFLILSDALTLLLDREIVPEFMSKAYKSASLPLLVFAVVIAAPIGEEVVFRGFILRSFTSSAGPMVAILISATVWAVIHLQYDAYGITTVLLGGILLGAIYHHTQSLSLCILLHAFWNLIATVEVFIFADHLW